MKKNLSLVIAIAIVLIPIGKLIWPTLRAYFKKPLCPSCQTKMKRMPGEMKGLEAATIQFKCIQCGSLEDTGIRF